MQKKLIVLISAIVALVTGLTVVLCDFKPNLNAGIGTYEYDAWGNHIVRMASGTIVTETATNTDVISQNPFRYRGYYYDKETKLYYTTTRYYDPQLGRFLNPDVPTNLFDTADVPFGANLYAYCLNNPVMYSDPSGEIVWFFIPLLIFAGGAAVGAGIEVGFQIAENGWNPGDWNWGEIGLSALFSGTMSLATAVTFGGAAPATGYGMYARFAPKAAKLATKAGTVAGKEAKYIQLNNKVSYSAAKKQYWKSMGSPTGNALLDANGISKVLHHPFGRQGANLYKVQVKTQAEHIAFHKANGYFYRNGVWTKLH